MVRYNRLEKEIENLNPDGSSKNSFPRASKKEIEKAISDMDEFKLRLSKDNIRSFSQLGLYLIEHLENLGAVYGSIKIGSPKYFGSDDYRVEVDYNFLEEEVKDNRRFDKEEKDNAGKEIIEDFYSYFKNYKVIDSGDGNFIIR